MPNKCLRQLSVLSMSQGSCVTLILVHACLIYLLKILDVLFRLFPIFNFETSYLISDKFRTEISDKNFEHFAQTFVPTNKKSTETSMKIVVLLHSQGFTDSTTRK